MSIVSIARSVTVEMIAENIIRIRGPNIIIGRQNKKKTNELLSWYDSQTKSFS